MAQVVAKQVTFQSLSGTRKPAGASSKGIRARQGAVKRASWRCQASDETKEESQEKVEKEEPKITMKGLGQLIKMGLGTVSGDITEVNLDDPTRTVVMELEANNFEDKDGNPLYQPDDEGFVDEAESDGSGFNPLNLAIPLALGAGATYLVVSTLQKL
eukprot:CAMPEP_0197847270 /NCGR_PEP_ID=MMETSP1438-20131217/5680_1 /TAXON_ID=1461541 /ORGANISM="Pterosperma sp., Strain CCMP1384" /LENGTH=157 /DNA_ID=CAMNT_0043459143 /DNA_START=50 /DNA_END=523 /DNA_ORIENTATION=+